MRRRADSARRSDAVFLFCVYAAAAFFVVIVAALFVMLTKGSWLSLQTFGLKFLWTSEWNPVNNTFGALPLIFGTVVSSLIAIVLAGLVGILAATFLADFAPRWMARPLSFTIELLAAVPSVVYGLWGLFVLAPLIRSYIGPALQKTLGFLPLFQGPIYGVGLLTAGIILAIMILPVISSITRDIMLAVPNSQREAVLALRARKGMVLDAADHDTWSVGSFFTNPVVAPDVYERLAGQVDGPVPHYPASDGIKLAAGWLVERAGFGKGYPDSAAGGAPCRLSSKHALALTNRGGATAKDVLTLARTVRDGVHDVFGITLKPEPVLVGCSL